jgi:putative FmdB family regulatory protein
MPIYDFQCTSCNFKDELLRKSSDAGTILCPKCSKETFSKMLSAPSFQLSGSGWYATDFKDKKSNKSTEATNKTETKPAEVETKAAACNPGCACH